MDMPNLPASLPPFAKLFATAYNTSFGGYMAPPRDQTRPFTAADILAWRQQYADKPQYDSVELEVASFIYSLIRMTGAKSILETGCSRGFSTCFLAAGVNDNGGGRVVSIDVDELFHLWEGSEVGKQVHFMKMSSTEALESLLEIDPNPSFDLLFLDSLHTYQHLMTEIMLFDRYLKVGGSILLHDTIFYDCLGPVAMELAANPRFETVTLPSPRDHGRKSRCPGVTLATKISDDRDTYPLSISQKYIGWTHPVEKLRPDESRDIFVTSIIDLLREEKLAKAR